MSLTITPLRHSMQSSVLAALGGCHFGSSPPTSSSLIDSLRPCPCPPPWPRCPSLLSLPTDPLSGLPPKWLCSIPLLYRSFSLVLFYCLAAENVVIFASLASFCSIADSASLAIGCHLYHLPALTARARTTQPHKRANAAIFSFSPSGFPQEQVDITSTFSCFATISATPL